MIETKSALVKFLEQQSVKNGNQSGALLGEEGVNTADMPNAIRERFSELVKQKMTLGREADNTNSRQGTTKSGNTEAQDSFLAVFTPTNDVANDITNDIKTQPSLERETKDYTPVRQEEPRDRTQPRDQEEVQSVEPREREQVSDNQERRFDSDNQDANPTDEVKVRAPVQEQANPNQPAKAETAKPVVENNETTQISESSNQVSEAKTEVTNTQQTETNNQTATLTVDDGIEAVNELAAIQRPTEIQSEDTIDTNNQTQSQVQTQTIQVNDDGQAKLEKTPQIDSQQNISQQNVGQQNDDMLQDTVDTNQNLNLVNEAANLQPTQEIVTDAIIQPELQTNIAVEASQINETQIAQLNPETMRQANMANTQAVKGQEQQATNTNLRETATSNASEQQVEIVDTPLDNLELDGEALSDVMEIFSNTQKASETQVTQASDHVNKSNLVSENRVNVVSESEQDTQASNKLAGDANISVKQKGAQQEAVNANNLLGQEAKQALEQVANDSSNQSSELDISELSLPEGMDGVELPQVQTTPMADRFTSFIPPTATANGANQGQGNGANLNNGGQNNGQNNGQNGQQNSGQNGTQNAQLARQGADAQSANLNNLNADQALSAISKSAAENQAQLNVPQFKGQALDGMQAAGEAARASLSAQLSSAASTTATGGFSGGEVTNLASQNTGGSASSANNAQANNLTQAQRYQHPMQVLGEQLAVNMKRSLNQNRTEVTLKLNPAELGHVQIKMEAAKGGRLKTHISVEKIETLELLKQDSRQLVQILQDAGLQTGSQDLSFDLGRQNDQALSDQDLQQNANFNPTNHNSDQADPMSQLSGQVSLFRRDGGISLNL